MQALKVYFLEVVIIPDLWWNGWGWSVVGIYMFPNSTGHDPVWARLPWYTPVRCERCEPRMEALRSELIHLEWGTQSTCMRWENLLLLTHFAKLTLNPTTPQWNRLTSEQITNNVPLGGKSDIRLLIRNKGWCWRLQGVRFYLGKGKKSLLLVLKSLGRIL